MGYEDLSKSAHSKHQAIQINELANGKAARGHAKCVVFNSMGLFETGTYFVGQH